MKYTLTLLLCLAAGAAHGQVSMYGLYPNATGAATTSLVLATSGKKLFSWQVQAGASAGYVLIYDLPADPGNGTGMAPKKCYAIAANSFLSSGMAGGPALQFANGIVIVFSTTGCFTETQSSTAFISGEAGN
jgi:hypothetical protein